MRRSRPGSRRGAAFAVAVATMAAMLAAPGRVRADESTGASSPPSVTGGTRGTSNGGVAPAPAAGDSNGLSGDTAETGRAIFAGGCFWCVEAAFDDVPGVVRTTSGFVGGRTENPTYEQVSAGGTGHAEAVEVIFDPRRVGYDRLLDVFWHNVDPLTAGRQFCDVGDQYRSAIFWLDEEQHRAALASKAALEKDGRFRGRIVTEIVPAARFWPAEEYHQDYHRKNPSKYRFYRWSCGRDERLREVWADAAPH